MRSFTLLAIFFIQLTMGCSESPSCVEPEADFSYTYIPTSDNPNCQNMSLLSIAEQTKCLHGGKVLVGKASTNEKPTMALTPKEADQHMQDSGIYPTTGGEHDEAGKNVPTEELVANLKALPDHLKANWLYRAPSCNSKNKNSSVPCIDYGPNGCGIWATAVCDRILGLKKGDLTQSEWDSTYADLGSIYGITPLYLIANYYQRKGFCSETRPMRGYYRDYHKINSDLASGCDVKLLLARKSTFWFLPSANPHIETVVDVFLPNDSKQQAGACPDCYMHTNSWGSYAKIGGGWCGDFFHEHNAAFGSVNDQETAWPEDDARVWVQTTCDCEKMENLSPNEELVKK